MSLYYPLSACNLFKSIEVCQVYILCLYQYKLKQHEKDFSFIRITDDRRYGHPRARRTQMGSDGRYEFQQVLHKAEKELPQIAQGVYLDMAALLSLKGAQINGNDASLKFNPYYLEIPIHMGYKYAINDNFAIFGNFGPYFAVGLFGKMKATGYLIDEVEGLTSIHDSAKVFGSNAMKRFDFGLGLKAGVEFFQKYQVSIGYDWGLLDNIEDSGNKNRNLMLSVGYFF